MVHASAVGAWGDFEVTHDVSHLTSAKFLNEVGKKSKVLLRVSMTGPEKGHSETARDVRGWGMKIFTEEGNQDFVFNSIVRTNIRELKLKKSNPIGSLCFLSGTQLNFLLSTDLISAIRQQIFRILPWSVFNQHFDAIEMANVNSFGSETPVHICDVQTANNVVSITTIKRESMPS